MQSSINLNMDISILFWQLQNIFCNVCYLQWSTYQLFLLSQHDLHSFQTCAKGLISDCHFCQWQHDGCAAATCSEALGCSMKKFEILWDQNYSIKQVLEPGMHGPCNLFHALTASSVGKGEIDVYAVHGLTWTRRSTDADVEPATACSVFRQQRPPFILLQSICLQSWAVFSVLLFLLPPSSHCFTARGPCWMCLWATAPFLLQ